MKSNFEFLQKDFPVLFQIGSIAEKYLFSDSNSCLIKLGMFGESAVNLMFQLDRMDPPKTENTHANRIRFLKKQGMLPDEIDEILNALRTSRNLAVHANLEDGERCRTLLHMAYNLAVWFAEVYGDLIWTRRSPPSSCQKTIRRIMPH